MFEKFGFLVHDTARFFPKMEKIAVLLSARAQGRATVAAFCFARADAVTGRHT